MSVVAFKVQGKSGDYVKTSLVPSNHSEEPHFGVLDWAIIGFFLICVAGAVTFFFL